MPIAIQTRPALPSYHNVMTNHIVCAPPVPQTHHHSGQVYATCTDLSAQLASKISPKRTVSVGKIVKYSVKVRNTLKTAGLPSDLGFTVQLPAGTTYVKSKAKPAIYGDGVSNNKRIVAEPIIDATANTVTWPDVPMPRKARRTFTVWARVLPGASGSLAFDSWLWQDSVANNPYCFNHAPPQSVRPSVHVCVVMAHTAA